MEQEPNYIPQIIIASATILTAVLSFALAFIFEGKRNYKNEKLKLKAQKQEIGKITEEIESIKILFTKETEQLRTELQKSLNYQISHRTEERNAIINFHEKYTQWLYALFEIRLDAYDRINLSSLKEKRIYIEHFYSNTLVAQSKIELLVKDEKIIKLSYKLVSDILAFNHWVDIRLLTIQLKIEEQIFVVDRVREILKNFDKNTLEKAAQDEEVLLREMKMLKEEFREKKIEEYSKTLPNNKLFTDYIKVYLTE